jgi:ABC-type siderophore export system fused ATPase/permease subunit
VCRYLSCMLIYDQGWCSRVIRQVYFSSLINLHTDFHTGCTNLHSYQQYIRVSFFPTSSPTFIVSVFLFVYLFVLLRIAILAEMRWYLTIIMICISFIAKNVEHFSMYFLAIYTFSSEKQLFNSFAHILIGLSGVFGV